MTMRPVSLTSVIYNHTSTVLPLTAIFEDMSIICFFHRYNVFPYAIASGMLILLTISFNSFGDLFTLWLFLYQFNAHLSLITNSVG